MCVRVEQRRPAGERGPSGRQLYRLPAMVLRPGDVQVFQKNSPRHTVNGQVVNHQGQLPGLGDPDRTQLSARGRIQLRAGRHQLCIGQGLGDTQAITRVHRPLLRDGQRPHVGIGSIAVLGTQPQGGMPVQQRLQHDDDVVLGHPGGSLQHDRLIELVGGTLYAVQPVHDRRSRHRADALVDDSGLAVREHGHRRYPTDGLFDEDVAWPAHHPGRPRPRHHLHRQDAVATEIEERLVDAHAIDSENLGVDIGQDLLDRSGRCAVIRTDTAIFGCGKSTLVQLAVHCQGQRLQHHHCGRNHVRREPFGQCGARLHRVGAPHDVADKALVAGTVLAGDHHRLLDSIQAGQCRLDLTQLDAIPADLHLLIGAAQVLQLAVLTPLHQISGAIHPRARPTERAGEEPRCGQSRAMRITGRDAVACDVKFADHALGRGPQPLVQHEQRRPGHRRTDRCHIRTRPQRSTHRRVNRGLGRAIGVDHRSSAGGPSIHQFGRAGFTGDDERRRLQPLRRQHPCGRRCLAQDADLLADQQLVQLIR